MKTVSFSGTCTARAEKVLVSPFISHPFTIKRIHCRFPKGCDDKMKLRFYVSPDKDAPTSGEPNGSSMLRDYGQVDYILGDGDTKDMDHEVEMSEGGSYLKVWAVNTDYYPHLIDVQMYIEVIDRKG